MLGARQVGAGRFAFRRTARQIRTAPRGLWFEICADTLLDMCGRYKITSTIEAIRQFTGSMGSPNTGPRYNLAPTQTAPVVRRGDGGDREVGLMAWGLRPHWSKKSFINARSESASTSSAFRAAYRERRCLIPADGYYEWVKVESGKQPYLFRREDQGPFAFAGIWDQNDADGAPQTQFAILTTGPSELVRPIHDRMPVILTPDQYAGWLGEVKMDNDALAAMTAPGGDEDFVVYPVSKRVNSVKNDDPACVEPAQ